MQFMPCLTSLALSLIYPFRKGRWPNTCFHILGVICTVYFFADAAFVTFGTNPYTLIFMDTIAQFMSFWVIPLIVFYMFSEWKHEMPDAASWLTLVPGFIIGLNSVRLYHKVGINKVSDAIATFKENGGHILDGTDPDLMALHFNNYTLNQAILLSEAVIAAVIIIIYMVRKHNEDGQWDFRYTSIGTTTLIALSISIVRVCLEKFFMLNHPVASAIMSFELAACFAFIGWQHYRREDIPAQTTHESNSPGYDDRTMATLKEKLVLYMEEEKPYLESDISLDKLAFALGTNRTYVSVLINSMLDMTFRDYINGLRVRDAKLRMLERKNTRMEDIAQDCGFTSGAQFSRKFKEIEGMSPNEWLRSQETLISGESAIGQSRQ